MTQYTVNETTAKVFRFWEELGGPSYISIDDVRLMFINELTGAEKAELPTWRKADDAKIGVFYQLPKRYRR